jgi:hypothetical protein
MATLKGSAQLKGVKKMMKSTGVKMINLFCKKAKVNRNKIMPHILFLSLFLFIHSKFKKVSMVSEKLYCLMSLWIYGERNN